MKIGILKSKVEKLLTESYGKNTFKDEIKNFKMYVLENKNISKLFYLYDELTSNKGLNESVIEDFVTECKNLYVKTSLKIEPNSLKQLNEWVKNIKTENVYSHIDELFSDNILTIESRIDSKKLIYESLKKKPTVKKEAPKVPISSMVSIANKTITNYIETLSESDKKELYNLL